MSSNFYDVVIAGAGPAGSTCATLCAEAGLRTLLLEKGTFPRDKVCGDCLNPGCWPVLDQLGVSNEILASPHLPIPNVSFVAASHRLTLPLHSTPPGEIAITRRLLDDILLRRAARAGADVRQNTPICTLSSDPTGLWHIGPHMTPLLVAADGRNSTVARLLGSAPPAHRDRVGLQSHAPTPPDLGHGIELHLFPEGYCGTAPVGHGLTNFCLVATAADLTALRSAVCTRFDLPATLEWHAIAPLERAPIGPLLNGVAYIGDAARVVEPFTGEGIYYALHSARLAARHIIAGTLAAYPATHAALYRRRLWINRLARWAVTHPRAGALLLRTLSIHPPSLEFLVQRVTGPHPT